MNPRLRSQIRLVDWFRASGFVRCLLLGCGATLHAATLQNQSLCLSVRDGVVTDLSNRLTGEVFVLTPTNTSLPAGLHRIGEPLLQVREAAEIVASNRVIQSLAWSNAARFELTAELEAASGDVIITQTGASSMKKLTGISWSIAEVPDSLEVLVPGCSGQRFRAEAPAGRREFDYPILWEAGFVLLQGREGGVLIRADDETPRYKNLVVEHARGVFRLRFESRNEAPWEDRDRIVSSRWRITAYRGPWQTGVALYRNWAESRRQLIPLEQQQPAWVRDARFVITMNLDTPLLAELARRCVPAQTLLYLPGWRRDEYDRNYPDYTATTNFDAFVTEAHRLGFRVMPHVNYFGCDPKHPLYAQFERFQMRDPFSKERLWWEWPAEPPIKFAYINPASRAWRDLFVARMKEVATRHRVDAFHLDQTLCIYNDANGRIDGLTCLEGNLALHRELRAALPEVALSGEGLNEITGQHEAFAQRHVWGMDHAHGTWDERLIALSHPVSSAVLTPYTHLYGYLGMVNPAHSAAFVAWRRAYEHFGVLPTYTWPDAAQLSNLSPYLAETLAQAAFFQQHQPVPDYDSTWATNDVFVYHLAGGGRAAFRRDAGVAFVRSSRREEAHGSLTQYATPNPKGNQSLLTSAATQEEVITRRLEGVNAARVAGSLPGWPAYDAERLFGLDPQRAYAWSAQPRDLSALRISALPEGVVIEQSGRHAEFARFRFREAAASDRIPLWSFNGTVVSGVRFADGSTRTGDALDFDDDLSGAVVHPEGEGLFLHPPWKGVGATRGHPATFIEFTLRLPQATRLTFESGVHLREGAVGKSDGVTFQVAASSGTTNVATEIHYDQSGPKPLRLDLSALAGQEARLSLEVNAGPKGDVSFDWARFAVPLIRIEADASPAQRTLTLSKPKTPSLALTSTDPKPALLPAQNDVAFEVPVPGSLILLHAEPPPVAVPADLLQTKFTSHIVYADGIETAAFSYIGGVITRAKCDGVERRALSLHPPPAGSSLADYLLRLPESPVRLSAAIGIRDGSKSKGVGFAVQVNGDLQFAQSLKPGSGWAPVSVDLSRWRGQPVLLTLVTDAEGSYEFDWAVWAEPRLEKQ